MGCLRTASFCAVALVVAHESPTRYTVTRDHNAYAVGEKKIAKDLVADELPSGATKTGAVAGGGFASVMDLTNLMRIPVRPMTHDGDATEHSSFIENADFVRSQEGYRHKGAVHKRGAGIEDAVQTELLKDLTTNHYLNEAKANASSSSDSEKKSEDVKADETDVSSDDKSELSMANLSDKQKIKEYINEKDHAWLGDDKKISANATTDTAEADTKSTTDATADDEPKAETDPDPVPEPAPQKHSGYGGHLDESELNDAVKYLYKMAGKIYDDPTVEKGYFMRIINEVPHVPTDHLAWPFWFFISLPSGLVGGIIIGGGVPFTSLHGDPGGFYFGFPIIMMIYAVALFAWLKRTGTLNPMLEDIAYFLDSGYFKFRIPKYFSK